MSLDKGLPIGENQFVIPVTSIGNAQILAILPLHRKSHTLGV
jgi:hypothetical protein